MIIPSDPDRKVIPGTAKAENGYQFGASSENITSQEDMGNSPSFSGGHDDDDDDDDDSLYTISSEYWDPPELSHRSLSWDVLSVETSVRRDAVIAVYSKVYAIAKVVSAICKNYGVAVCSVSASADLYPVPLTPMKLDYSSTGLKFHLRQAEENVLSNSIPTLIKIVEDLYYVLYARLVIEMSNVQLCSSFNLDIRRKAGMDRFFLPEPKHLYAIFCSCKDVLDSPEVCKELDKEIIKQHQERFIRETARRSTDMKASDYAGDSTGYRRYIMQLTSDPNSPLCQKWRGLNPVFQMAPGEILAVLSEKYLSVTPRERRISNALKHFPFLDWESVDSELWERKAIEAHRQAALAMLEGKSVGDKRREDFNRPLIDYVRERKCVCYGFCACAKRCTHDAERLCPCAERTMSIFLSLDPEELPFASRCTILAEIIFDGFSKVDASTEIAEEVQFALDIFEREIKDHRRTVRRVRFW
jgi:hypothetical protein